ncbi:hypothetical protein QBC39DRAFT_391685 [Podospora conica]|nr:hypothetical protein QBC39DRAFT_391685 [Schizothecium conicum]
MNVDLPNLINATLDRHDQRHGNDTDQGETTHTSAPGGSTSRRKQRNVAVLQDNWTGGSMNHNDPSFLSSGFPRNPPKLFVASDDDEPDPAVVAAWRAEGFNVLAHLPLGLDGDPAATLRGLHRRAGLAPCETYGVVAFGEAAARVLEHFHVLDNNPELKLGLVVAYYPTRIPDPRTRFPSAVRGVVVHLALAEGTVGVVKQSQMVGIQGKKRVVKRKLPERGMGVGGRMEGEGWGGYEIWGYEGAEAGFAEEGLEEYDGISAGLAWARSLGVARGALLGMQNDGRGEREEMVDAFWDAKLEDQDLGETLDLFSAETEPSVTYVPTCTGGTGMDELEEFYADYFLEDNPPSLETTLLSRTVGADRVVDEVFVTFKHSQMMPWILPGVPPTNKRVEIAMVSIVSFKGGKIQHEHVYWDQASVLMQVGLLNPKVVPRAGKEKGVTRLPVLGKTASRRVFGSASGVQDVEANGLLGKEEDGVEEDGVEEDGVADEKEGETGEGDKVEPEKEVDQGKENEPDINGNGAKKDEEEKDKQNGDKMDGDGWQLNDGSKKKKRGGKKKNAQKEEDSQAAGTTNGFGSIP